MTEYKGTTELFNRDEFNRYVADFLGAADMIRSMLGEVRDGEVCDPCGCAGDDFGDYDGHDADCPWVTAMEKAEMVLSGFDEV